MCEYCGDTGIAEQLTETVPGCGGWFSSDGKVYTAELTVRPK